MTYGYEPMGSGTPEPVKPVAPEPEKTAVDDETFMENVREAIENGYDRCCVKCGTGVYDGYEIHDRACPEYDPDQAR